MIGRSVIVGHLYPAGHASHVPLPVVFLYVPNAHALHVNCPRPLQM